MSDPVRTLDLQNVGKDGLKLVLEPEGAEFVLPPGEVARVHISGEEPAVLLKCSCEDGRSRISFWPDKGTYEIYIKGKRVWELL